MLIREAKPGDSARIAELLDQLGYPGTSKFIRKKIIQSSENSDATLLVAVNGRRVCGLIALHFINQIALPGDFCRISYLCVDRPDIGTGIGRALIARAEGLARARRCDRMEVHCHARRKKAHRFYFTQGYQDSPKYLLKMLHYS